MTRSREGDPALRRHLGVGDASLGSLLALLLGVSRTALAMARDRHLPGALAFVDERRGVPRHAEPAVNLPLASALSGAAVLALGVVAYVATGRRS